MADSQTQKKGSKGGSRDAATSGKSNPMQVTAKRDPSAESETEAFLKAREVKIQRPSAVPAKATQRNIA